MGETGLQPKSQGASSTKRWPESKQGLDLERGKTGWSNGSQEDAAKARSDIRSLGGWRGLGVATLESPEGRNIALFCNSVKV